MDLRSVLLDRDKVPQQRDLTQDELDEMERQLRMKAPRAEEQVIRRKQRELYPDMRNKAWWEYPLLNQPYTRQVPQPMKYGPRQFQTVTPVLLSPKEKQEQDALLRKFRDQDEKLRLSKIKNPLLKAWQMVQDQFNAETY